MIVTANLELAERTRALRQYGWRQRYISEVPGCNSRLDELQAAILRVKLEYLESENTRRIALAARYTAALTDSSLTLPSCRADARHVYHQYVVRSPQRNALQHIFVPKESAHLFIIPKAVHQPTSPTRGAFPSLEPYHTLKRTAAEVLSLPIYPELTEEQWIS